MNLELLVPDIGDFDQVEVIEVLVKKGDNLKKNDAVITLESDKSSVEVPSTIEGSIKDIIVKVGDKVSKGDVILLVNGIENKDEKIPPLTEKIIEEAENTIQYKDNLNQIKKPDPIENIKKNNIEFVSNKDDIDPVETKEWVESLTAVVQQEGSERANFLIKQLIDHAYRQGSKIPYTQSTPYINTIPPEEETKSPGDQNIERRLRSLIRWNAAAMVVRANKKFPELGGHIGTFASAATLYDVGMNHFWRAKSDNFGGDN